jgi:hypothetical protein
MELNDFVQLVNRTNVDEIDQRRGQFAFNALYEVRPDLSEQIRSNFNLDPFYDDDVLPAFFGWLQENWAQTEETPVDTEPNWDYSVEGYEAYLAKKLKVAKAVANSKGYRDGTVIEFDANGGLTFAAIYKGGKWWTTTTIGKAANDYYNNLSILLDSFEDITRFVVYKKGKELYVSGV